MFPPPECLFRAELPRPTHWQPPPERTPTRREAVITGVCVTAGLVAALVALPPAETPGYAAKTFVQAGIQEDWRAAWDLVCRPAREAAGGFASFVEQMNYVNGYNLGPTDVDVDIEDIRGQAGPVWIVSVAMTSDDNEDWEDRGEIPVVLEDGHFRVCTAAAPAP
jgi:hypothetical protein